MEVLTFNFDSITLHLKQTNKRKEKENICEVKKKYQHV